MNTRPRYAFTLLISLLAWTASLPAADGQGPAVSIQFTALSWDRPVRGIFFNGAGGKEAIHVPNRARSHSHTYRGDGKLYFYREVQADDGSIKREVVGKLALPEGTKGEMLLLFAPGRPADGKESYRIMPLKDELSDFAAGDLRVYNMTTEPLAMKLGETMLKVGPRDHLTQPFESSGSSALVTILVPDEKKGWKKGYSSRWGVQEQTRFTLFVIPDRTVTGISVKKYRDAAPEVAANGG